ncbi:hypothetical protein GCM10009347_36280 [Shewanella algicola]|nr:hypothetical protein GCM10009347_36280 [Shewanella algicola]
MYAYYYQASSHERGFGEKIDVQNLLLSVAKNPQKLEEFGYMFAKLSTHHNEVKGSVLEYISKIADLSGGELTVYLSSMSVWAHSIMQLILVHLWFG